MDIHNRKELSSFAAGRLENAPQHKKIALIYASVVVGLSAISALVNYMLGLQIDQSGGLSNMGTRSVLSALQSMLPLVQTAVIMCVELGFCAAMLRVARGQYVSPNTLRLGFDRFWVLLRYTVLEGLLYAGIAMGSAYLGMSIFLFTPWAQEVIELLTPFVAERSVLDASVTIPDALYVQVMDAMTPALILCSLLGIAGVLPLFYRLRMSRYVIIDKPAFGALAAMRESRKMTHRHCFQLFRLDLHFWWFHGANAMASILCYGDMLLPMLGVELPISPDAAFFLFYALYWIAEYLIFYFLLSRVTTTLALAYDSLCPKEEAPQGVILGNIFQM